MTELGALDVGAFQLSGIAASGSVTESSTVPSATVPGAKTTADASITGTVLEQSDDNSFSRSTDGSVTILTSSSLESTVTRRGVAGTVTSLSATPFVDMRRFQIGGAALGDATLGSYPLTRSGESTRRFRIGGAALGDTVLGTSFRANAATSVATSPVASTESTSTTVRALVTKVGPQIDTSFGRSFGRYFGGIRGLSGLVVNPFTKTVVDLTSISLGDATLGDGELGGISMTSMSSSSVLDASVRRKYVTGQISQLTSDALQIRSAGESLGTQLGEFELGEGVQAVVPVTRSYGGETSRLVTGPVETRARSSLASLGKFMLGETIIGAAVITRSLGGETTRVIARGAEPVLVPIGAFAIDGIWVQFDELRFDHIGTDIGANISRVRQDALKREVDTEHEIETINEFAGGFTTVYRPETELENVKPPRELRDVFVETGHALDELSVTQESPSRFDLGIGLLRGEERSEEFTVQETRDWVIDSGDWAIGVNSRDVELPGDPSKRSFDIGFALTREQMETWAHQLAVPSAVVERRVPDGDAVYVDTTPDDAQTVEVTSPGTSIVPDGEYVVSSWEVDMVQSRRTIDARELRFEVTATIHG